ncbi:MAG: hypothetical protein ACQESF_05850 [Nanobdellota archaeon]
MRTKKAQVSLEFLMVTGFIMIVLMGSLSFLAYFAKTSTDEFISQRVEGIGETIVNTAELLGVYGEPSRRIIEFNFPPRISNITIENGHYLFIQVQGRSGTKRYYGFYSSHKMNGEFKKRDYTPGKHYFLMQINESNNEVNIQRWV